MKYSAKQGYSRYINWLLVIASLGYIYWMAVRPLFNGGINITAYILQVVTALFPLGVTIFFLLSRLSLEIDEAGISYKYWPVHRKGLKYIPWDNVKYIYARKVKPVKEYGGWGIRYTQKRGAAYILSGNYGLQIHLKTGEAILIGVKDPKKLIAYLDKLMDNDVVGKELLPPSSTPFS